MAVAPDAIRPFGGEANDFACIVGGRQQLVARLICAVAAIGGVRAMPTPTFRCAFFVYPIAQLMAKLLWQHAVADAVQIDKRLVNRVDLRAAPALQAGSLPG